MTRNIEWIRTPSEHPEFEATVCALTMRLRAGQAGTWHLFVRGGDHFGYVASCLWADRDATALRYIEHA